MKRIQSRATNVALIVLGAVLTLLGFAGVLEELWMGDPAGLLEPNRVIWTVVFLGLGLWCGLGGWMNLRNSHGHRVG